MSVVGERACAVESGVWDSESERSGKAKIAKKRAYDNTLRERRAAQTREKILSALTELLAVGAMEDVSFSRLAKRAGVSEPTVYRHFSNRDALFAALDQALLQRFVHPEAPELLDEVPDYITALFEAFDANTELILSFFHSKGARQTRQRQRQPRLDNLRRMVDRAFPALSLEERLEFFALLQLLASGDAWKSMREFADLDGGAAGRAVARALRMLIAEATERNKAAAGSQRKTQS